jgi:hypothetical protein
MVMYPHTKYNWPIWKDKKVRVWTSFAEEKKKKKKKKKRKRRSGRKNQTKTICLPSFEGKT